MVYCKDVESQIQQCPPQHCFSDIFTRTNQVLLEQCIIIRSSDFFINVQVQGNNDIPFQVAGLLRAWQISYKISRYVYHESFLSLQFLSVICFHVILGLPGSCFPSTCMSKALLTAPLEHSTCPYQQSHFSSRMRYRSSMQTRTSNSLDLVVTMSCSLTLQICLIIALSTGCRHWRFGFVNGQVLLAWSIALYTQHLYT